MFLGSNLQHLRKTHGGMTQEKLAEQMGVSRQTISKWESGEASPELSKLVDLCDIFQCRLDELLRQDLASRASIYYPVRIQRIAGFRRAQYIMITQNPEEDAAFYMDHWAQARGLNRFPGVPVKIGWNFPYITQEQKSRFGLRGYVCAYILPEGFEPSGDGVQLVHQETADYAVMTIRDPFAADPGRVSQAYHLIFEYLTVNGFKKKHSDKVLPTFQRIYEKDGTTYMDLFIHCDCGGKYNEFINML